MREPSVYLRALLRACAVAGGDASRLGVPPPQLEDWLRGQSVPDMSVFLQIVAIALHEGPSLGSPHER